MAYKKTLLAAWALISLGLSLSGNCASAASGDTRVVLPDSIVPRDYEIEITPDVEHLSFRGHLRIDLEVMRATRDIELNAADLKFDRVALVGRSEKPKVSINSAQETATFSFSNELAPGLYVFEIEYRGKINQQASGLFALDYAVAGTSGKRALFTQFENSDARRFLPCWDEPGRKATFSLSATIPADETPVSNMPVATVEKAGAGLQRVHFARTPKMSSYLLFFAAGDFERAHRIVGGVDVGVIVKRGDLERGRFALETAVQFLPYYNDYFGTPYPLPKLDLIAAPGSSQFFGAMENWGAILYFERDLLIDARLSTEQDRQYVAVVIAHEMAHQWFGDLVTMAWWDDLWLNEGFASWMENKAVDHFHPEWKLWLQSQSAVQQAMRIDAARGTHPIITPIRDVLQASDAFDSITYIKGGAVIRMLESYVGEDAFRAGVRRYMKEHAYGNTVTDDLWKEVDAISPTKIMDVAHDFTLQAGVPLISAQAEHCASGTASVDLAQTRFGVDESSDAGAKQWRVPVAFKMLGSADVAHLTVAGAAGKKIQLARCAPLLLNVGQSGYFRSRYAPAAFAALAGRYQELAAEDQLGLLSDTEALAFVGAVPVAQFLDLTKKLPADADALIWNALTESLLSLDEIYAGRPGQDTFRSYARALLARPFARIGWDARAGEPDNVATQRVALLGAMGHFGDAAVLAEARRRFATLLDAPSRVSATQRKAVLLVIAESADGPSWDKLHKLARSAATELEKQDYYRYLGAAQSPQLAQRALDLALTDEAPMTLRPLIIGSVASAHADLAADYAIAHWDAISPLLEADSRGQFVPHLASGSSDLEMLARLHKFAEAHIPASAHRSVEVALASIRYHAKIGTRLGDIDQWIGAASKHAGAL